MLHYAEAVAIAQSRRQSVDELYDEMYAQLEARSEPVEGTMWEARIDYTDADSMDSAWPSGYILAADRFGTLLASLHVRGFLTGEHPDDERVASVRRVPA